MLFTRNMRVHGHANYANFNVWCTHLIASGDHLIAWGKDQAVEMVDLWLPEFGNYAMNMEVCKDDKPKKIKPAPYWEIGQQIYFINSEASQSKRINPTTPGMNNIISIIVNYKIKWL